MRPTFFAVAALTTIACSTAVTSAKFTSQDVIISGDDAIETRASEVAFQAKQPDGSYQVVRDIYTNDAPPR